MWRLNAVLRREPKHLRYLNERIWDFGLIGFIWTNSISLFGRRCNIKMTDINIPTVRLAEMLDTIVGDDVVADIAAVTTIIEAVCWFDPPDVVLRPTISLVFAIVGCCLHSQLLIDIGFIHRRHNVVWTKRINESQFPSTLLTNWLISAIQWWVIHSPNFIQHFVKIIVFRGVFTIFQVFVINGYRIE